MVDTLGSCAQRCDEATGRISTLPGLTGSPTPAEVGDTNVSCVSPAIIAGTACATPLDGMCWNVVPDSSANCSMPNWCTLAFPDEP